jgi:SAM-dependent methyltransferase
MDIATRLATTRDRIAAQSPFDAKETARITNKWFHHIPRSVVVCLDKYQFDQKKVLDIGSSFGQSLLFWGKESEGVDIQPDTSEFCQAMGHKIHHINMEDGFPAEMKGQFDAVYTSNLFEHLLAPHLFLLRAHSLLRPGGLLAIAHPVVPTFPFRSILEAMGMSGWLAAEHVNFFTPRTAKLTFEYGGFKVLQQYNLGLPDAPGLRSLLRPVSIQCLSICQKIDGYQYTKHRDPLYDPSWAADSNHFRS